MAARPRTASASCVKPGYFDRRSRLSEKTPFSPRLEMFVEPIHDDGEILVGPLEIVPAPFADDQFRRHTGVLETGHDRLGLLDRHEDIRVAVNDQRRRP